MNKIKAILSLFWFLLIVFLTLFLWVLNTLPPAGAVNLSLFYLSLFVASLALFTLAGFYVRRRFGSREWASRYLVLSARQGLWLAILLAASLVLISIKLFSWFNAAFLVLALIFLEGYLLTKEKL